jgi:hypothetical protein
MEPEDNFRNLIRSKLRGSFDTEADKQGLKMVDEVDPPGQNVQQGAGVNQANVEKSVKGLFLSLGNVIKTNNKLGSGVSVGLKDSDLKKMSTEVATALVKGDTNAFKKSIANGVDAIDKKILDFAKKQQAPQAGVDSNQGNQEGQPGAGPDQPLKAAESPGHDVQTLGGANPATIEPPAAYEAPMRERENPISVSAMQGILKFATPTQVGDAIKAMDSDQFAKFASGLQKDALDVLSAAVNNQGGGKPPAPEQGGKPTPGQTPGQSGGDNNAEGNLKLGDL